MNRISLKTISICIWVCTFVGLCYFLFIAHPMILCDADDWYYASYWRRPLPIFGSFNSIKVFPETFMPLCSLIAANIVLPVTGDYLISLAFVYAVTGAVFITVYAYLLARLVEAASNCRKVAADAAGICFLMLHFLVYKNNWTENVHLFWTYDVTCFFHYTLSAMISACVVLYLMREETICGRSISLEIADGRFGYYKAGILVFIIYLSVFSNSFNNIILAVYSGTHALRYILLKKRIKEYFIHMVIILAWVIAVFFQMFDARNENARSQGMKGNMSGAVKGYLSNFSSMNKMAILLLALVVTAFVAVIIIDRKERQNGNMDARKQVLCGFLIETVLSFVMISVYLILLCGVASPGYITRTDVKIGVFFYLFVVVAVMMGYLLGNKDENTGIVSFIGKMTCMIMPLIAFVLISQTLNYCKSYRDYNLSGMPFERELVIGRDLIAQFEKADSDGLEEFDLHVLLNDTAGDNWPYPDYSGDLIGDALFRHGVITRPIAAHTVFDDNKNTELGIK